MLKLRFVMVFFAMILFVSVAEARSGVPDLVLSTSSRSYRGPETAVLFVLPNGGGSAFTSAAIVGGVADATITLTVLDGAGSPIPNHPFEDLWLESADGGMVTCTGGSTADENTDALGQTSWVSPLQAGGHSEGLTVVMINGLPLESGPGELVSFNSADFNGDGVVNMSDVVFFVSDLNGAYNFRSDFAFDGVVNLSDVVIMITALGVSCP